jgi:hypothetical protein
MVGEMHDRTNVCMYICMYIPIHVCVCMCVCDGMRPWECFYNLAGILHTYMQEHMYACMARHTYVCMHTPTSLHACAYVCDCMLLIWGSGHE